MLTKLPGAAFGRCLHGIPTSEEMAVVGKLWDMLSTWHRLNWWLISLLPDAPRGLGGDWASLAPRSRSALVIGLQNVTELHQAIGDALE